MYIKLSIPERLKDLRVVDKHLTLEQLAEQTGLSRSALSKYESDDYKDISPFAIATLAEFYGVSTDYLMGLTEHKKHPNTELHELHLSDGMVELLKSGKVNNRLLCELATHKDFPRLMADITIMVDRIADMRIQQLNRIMESARQEIQRQHASDKDDLYMRTLEIAQVDEDEYFNHVVHGDIDRIVRDIRDAHKTDTTTADEQPDHNKIQEHFLRAIRAGNSGEEAFIQVFCEEMAIPYEKLTSEEFSAFMRILGKSKNNKKQQSMRGKGSPIPPHMGKRRK